MGQQHAGKLVKDARKRLGMTQAAFAQTLQRGQSLISKYERGAVDPPGEILMCCMGILGSPVQARVASSSLHEVIEAHLERLSANQLRSMLLVIVEKIAT